MDKNSELKDVLDYVEGEKPTGNIKQFLVLAILGYIFYLFIRYVEIILGHLIELCAIYFFSDTIFFQYQNIIPQLFMLLFWVIIIFKYIKGFNGYVSLTSSRTKLFAKRIFFITVILFIIQTALYHLVTYVKIKMEIIFTTQYNGLYSVHLIINSVLRLIQIIVIVIGYFKILRNINVSNQ